MKNLLKYEDYHNINTNEIIDESINVYDNDKIKDPFETINQTAVLKKIDEYIKDNSIKEISIIAYVPINLKTSPDYIRDIVKKERDRREEKQRLKYGSRIERADRPDDDELDDINIDVPSDFIVDRIENDIIVAYPRKYYYLTINEPSKKEYYKTYIKPQNIDDIYIKRK